MTFQHCGQVTPNPAYVGIAIKSTSQRHQRMHVGLLYRHSSGGIRFAHLAMHNNLCDDPLPLEPDFLWSDCEALSHADSLSEFVADFIEMCAQSKQIPYGPNPPEAAFDEKGRYRSRDVSEGLTCATYVSSVLHGAGFPVVQLETWQSRPDDAQWWSPIFDYLNVKEPARAAELKGISVGFRLRPDEVAVASTCAHPPISYDDALIQSRPLQQLLFPPPPPRAELNASEISPQSSISQIQSNFPSESIIPSGEK